LDFLHRNKSKNNEEKMKPKLAVIQFPGSNCEYETAYAAQQYGFEVEIVRWNMEKDGLSAFDAYIIPGGFSFQDRIRAGVISSKLPIMLELRKAADEGKLILGICNGCQILAEAGFFPNIAGNYTVEAGLAPNQKDGQPIGFICDWVYVKVTNPQASIFTKYFNEEDVIPIPINHGEGRFILQQEIGDAWQELARFQYCTENGEIKSEFPTTLNGSSYGLAALCNKSGNVMAIMPHPERASFTKQMPTWLNTPWVKQKQEDNADQFQTPGPWGKLFQAMADHCAN
jgi:phosphoribosylformylglycinamidine synthase